MISSELGGGDTVGSAMPERLMQMVVVRGYER